MDISVSKNTIKSLDILPKCLPGVLQDLVLDYVKNDQIKKYYHPSHNHPLVRNYMRWFTGLECDVCGDNFSYISAQIPFYYTCIESCPNNIIKYGENDSNDCGMENRKKIHCDFYICGICFRKDQLEHQKDPQLEKLMNEAGNRSITTWNSDEDFEDEYVLYED